MFVFKENISTLIFYLDLHSFDSHLLFIAIATREAPLLFTFFFLCCLCVAKPPSGLLPIGHSKRKACFGASVCILI